MTDVMEPKKVSTGTGNEHDAAASAERLTEPTGKRRPVAKVVIALVLVAGTIFGVRYWLHARAYETTDDAYIEGHIVQVSPRVMGHVRKVFVDDNERVKASDPLIELDPADFQARLEQAQAVADNALAGLEMMKVTAPAGTQQAQAAVEAARASITAGEAKVQSAKVKIEQAAAQVRAAQATVEQGKAEVQAAEAQYRQSQIDIERYQKITQQGGSTQYEVERAQTASTVALANLNAARKAVLAAEAQLAVTRTSEGVATEGLRQEEAGLAAARAAFEQSQAKYTETNVAGERVQMAQAQYDQAVATVEQASLQLEYTKVFATTDGRVTRKSVEPGAYVQVGQALLAVVPDHVWIVANYKETQLRDMRVGQRAEIHVDAYPSHTFQGHVDSIQAGTGAKFSLLPPENATGNFVKVVQRVPIKIVLDEQPGEQYHLGPGMSVIAEVRVQGQ